MEIQSQSFSKKTGVLIIMVLALVSLSTAFAQDNGPIQSCPTSDGGGMPTPFSDLNQKVELADGENYVLIGTIRNSLGTWFLEIDLTQHKWLATQQRAKNPFYPITLKSDFLSLGQHDGKKFQIFVTAHGVIINNKYVIDLELNAAPKSLL
jgi:hypothetical protein